MAQASTYSSTGSIRADKIYDVEVCRCRRCQGLVDRGLGRRRIDPWTRPETQGLLLVSASVTPSKEFVGCCSLIFLFYFILCDIPGASTE